MSFDPAWTLDLAYPLIVFTAMSFDRRQRSRERVEANATVLTGLGVSLGADGVLRGELAGVPVLAVTRKQDILVELGSASPDAALTLDRRDAGKPTADELRVLGPTLSEGFQARGPSLERLGGMREALEAAASIPGWQVAHGVVRLQVEALPGPVDLGLLLHVAALLRPGRPAHEPPHAWWRAAYETTTLPSELRRHALGKIAAHAAMDPQCAESWTAGLLDPDGDDALMLAAMVDPAPIAGAVRTLARQVARHERARDPRIAALFARFAEDDDEDVMNALHAGSSAPSPEALAWYVAHADRVAPETLRRLASRWPFADRAAIDDVLRDEWIAPQDRRPRVQSEAR